MLNIVELFSGIGSQAKALKNLGIETNPVGTCEWDVHAIVAYDLIHNGEGLPDYILAMSKTEILDVIKRFTFSNSGKEALEYDSIKTYSLQALQRIYASIIRNHNFVDISALKGSDLPGNIDILTYSFPCQDLCNVGAFHGYNKGIDKDSGSRSSLLWQVGRVLSEMKQCRISLPRFLVMENVPALLSKRHFPNFSMWINDLRKLGYVSKYYELNASDFGLPQNRPRLLMISVFVGDNRAENNLVLDYFKQKCPKDVIDDYKRSSFYRSREVKDLLRTDYSDKEIFDEAVECTPNNTTSRQRIWDENPQLVLPSGKINKDYAVIRTITTKQDRNPNSGNLFFDSGIEGRSKFRYLTPRECMLFMGFSDEDYERLKNNNVEFHKGDALFARDKVIRLSGNSIPVKLLEGIFLQVIQIQQMLEDYRREKSGSVWEEYVAYNKQRIRSYLFRKGIRSRIPNGQYPSSADLVYSGYKTAIFICDCFWHGHSCCNGLLPVINRVFWEKETNQYREAQKQALMQALDLGWHVIVLWSCELDDSVFSETMEKTVAIMQNERRRKKYSCR